MDKLFALALQYQREHKLETYDPYLKQREFHALGADHDERALIAGNQTGKTWCTAMEDAIHLTGMYPSWWTGKKFDHPTRMWIAGPNGEKVRDTTQQMLYGPWNRPEEFGTGALPKDCIVGRPTFSRGVSGYYDTGLVRWKDKNGKLDDSAVSEVTFKAYTEGQLAFASNTIDVFHGDEELPMDTYTEARTRIQVRRGISYLSLTPLLGWTILVTRFLLTPAVNRIAVKMGLYDCYKGYDPSRPNHGHYADKAHVDATIAGFAPHLRDCKAFGDPAIGEGKVFMVDENEIKMEPIPLLRVPRHWYKLGGLDFGGSGSGSHPFAYVLTAHDRDNDIIYLLKTLKMQGVTKFQHIPAIRALAANVPVAWPHDGNERREGAVTGETLADQYKKPMEGMPGLTMLPEHSTWEEGGFSTEAAVTELDDRCRTGRFRVSDECTDFLDEYRNYHREKNLLVKVNDDLLSALYKTLMMKRFAKALPLGGDQFERFGLKSNRPSFVMKPTDPFTGAAIRVDNSRDPY